MTQWTERQAGADKKCGESAAPMNISVKTPDDRIIPFEVKPCHTVGSVKKRILVVEGFEPDRQLRLIYNDRQLQDGFKLSHYNIQNESTLRLEIRRRVSECEWQTLPVNS